VIPVEEIIAEANKQVESFSKIDLMEACFYVTAFCDGVKWAIEKIEEDNLVKRARIVNVGMMGFNEYECSNCKSDVSEEITENFCSNCGVKFIKGGE